MLDFLPTGEMLVSSYFTDNILRFNATNGASAAASRCQSGFGSGAYLGEFAAGVEGPVGIAVDGERVYVASYKTDTVGRVLEAWLLKVLCRYMCTPAQTIAHVPSSPAAVSRVSVAYESIGL